MKSFFFRLSSIIIRVYTKCNILFGYIPIAPEITNKKKYAIQKGYTSIASNDIELSKTLYIDRADDIEVEI